MSDISKINPNGTEYNLKDATARTNMGNLSNLETTKKTDLVSAVNEVKSGLNGKVNGGLYSAPAGDTLIDVEAVTQAIVAFTTYAEYSIYLIFRESATSIFCHQISKSNGGATVSYDSANKIKVSNPTAFGGVVTVMYKLP